MAGVCGAQRLIEYDRTLSLREMIARIVVQKRTLARHAEDRA
jgi:hypothetical protein